MTRACSGICFAALSAAAFGQTPATLPRFEIADVHVSPRADWVKTPRRLPMRVGHGAAAPDGQASDPTGGISFADAIEKQLGLKLEKQKRPEPVLVIDHIEERPTEN